MFKGYKVQLRNTLTFPTFIPNQGMDIQPYRQPNYPQPLTPNYPQQPWETIIYTYTP